ncbi:unnamed protein product, partial [Brassica oleracea var. botrytis]
LLPQAHPYVPPFWKNCSYITMANHTRRVGLDMRHVVL